MKSGNQLQHEERGNHAKEFERDMPGRRGQESRGKKNGVNSEKEKHGRELKREEPNDVIGEDARKNETKDMDPHTKLP